MKLGIIGLPQTGKKTLFKILTGTEISETQDASKPLMGTATIRDDRFNALSKMYNPKKNAPAKIELALLPKIEQDTLTKETFLKDLSNLDALCHVVRAFEDEAIYHREGSVNPKRDIDMINDELILQDLVFIEKRLERLENSLIKKKTNEELKEQAIMLKLKSHLDENKPLRSFSFDENESKMLSGYPFLTRKSLILVLNVCDDKLQNPTLLNKLLEAYKTNLIEIMIISAKLEQEIACLDSVEEQEAFLSEMGIKSSALNTLTGLCLKSLGLMSFFTVGEDEVKQWLVKKEATAPEAAGAIHSDLQRGFIRAELMKYEELIEYKTETNLKNAGKHYLKGKDYTVEDGDILNIRFKV